MYRGEKLEGALEDIRGEKVTQGLQYPKIPNYLTQH